MKLEVGMYVRFEGKINKIIEIEDDDIVFYDNWYDHWLDEVSRMNVDRFIKDYKPIVSFNIIDLIEVGDYVNGKKVIDKWEEPDWYDYFIKLDGEKTIPTTRNIETIVTKEQFEQMSYKVGD